jgi:molybdopterin molybdotransferase
MLTTMMPVEEALARILATVRRLDGVELPLLDALGQVLDEDAVATFDIPPLPNTAMDGYAVVAASTAGAAQSNPVTLRVTGELAAGYVYSGRVEPGAAVRIMTGAPIPTGADAIVPFEETDESGLAAPSGAGAVERSVRVLKAAEVGANVRAAGEDVRRGELVLPRDTLLNSARLGVLASLGRASVRVVRRPVVAILSTGDELVPPGRPLGPGQIYDSNAYSIAAAVRAAGGAPRMLGIARDTIAELTERLLGALDADLVITSAGVSRGDYDVVKEVLKREGSIGFHTVNMRPGKPLAFGLLRDAASGREVPHLGLPGNPVSSLVVFELFGRFAVQKLLGRPLTPRREVWATTRDRLRMADERRFYARVVVEAADDGYICRLAGSQSSGALSALARANGLAVVPENSADVEAGSCVRIMLLDEETPL